MLKRTLFVIAFAGALAAGGLGHSGTAEAGGWRHGRTIYRTWHGHVAYPVRPYVRPHHVWVPAPPAAYWAPAPPSPGRPVGKGGFSIATPDFGLQIKW